MKIKHGKNFGGLLDAADVVHALETPKGSKLGALFILKNRKNSSTNFYETFKNAVYTTNLVRCPKTHSVLKKSLGHLYYLKNRVTLSECVHKITVTNSGEKIVDKSTFMKFLHESEDIPLPRGNSGLWDVFIGTHPIQWSTENTDDSVEFYPILFRFHHSLFDGYHLIKTIFDNFSDHKVTELRVLSNDVVKRSNSVFTLRNTFSRIKSCIRYLYIIIITPWRYFMMTKALAKDCNILCGKELNDEKLFGFNIEEHPYYIDIIKTAKRRFPGASFTDIILTAISMALTKHFKKNSALNIPEHITVATPEVPDATKLLQNSTSYNGKKETVCQNKVKFSLRKLPIGKEFRRSDKRLEIISKQSSYFKNPSEVEADYIVTHSCFALLPVPILLRLFKLIRYTAIVTNLPGPKATSFCNGHHLQDILVWSISKNTTRTGISFLISTYDNRLGVTMAADKAVISNCEDVESIVQSIYVAIDDLSNSINHNDIAKAG